VVYNIEYSDKKSNVPPDTHLIKWDQPRANLHFWFTPTRFPTNRWSMDKLRAVNCLENNDAI